MFHIFYPPEIQPELSFGILRFSSFAKTAVIWINYMPLAMLQGNVHLK